MSNKLILGVDIGDHILTMTGSMDHQTEGKSDTYLLSSEKDGTEITLFLMEFMKKHFQTESADMIVYSTENFPISRCKAFESMLKTEGIVKGGVRLISRENAFVHYILNEDKELHQHTVVAFEHTGTELWGYRLYYPNKKVTNEMKTERQLIGAFSLVGDNITIGRMMDQKFADVAKQVLSKEVVSAVYLTGPGFEGDWLTKSLKVICDGRRAFFGQNLFSAGCLNYGRNMSQNKKSQYTIQAPETVLYECGVVDSGTKDSFVPITEAGHAWYETKGSIDVILERGGKVDIVFSHMGTKEKQVESVDISGLPGRPRKTGRMEIAVEFSGNQTGVILVRDKGFGQFIPDTHQVFLKEFTLL